jgi:hypothetical protein
VAEQHGEGAQRRGARVRVREGHASEEDVRELGAHERVHERVVLCEVQHRIARLPQSTDRRVLRSGIGAVGGGDRCLQLQAVTRHQRRQREGATRAHQNTDGTRRKRRHTCCRKISTSARTMFVSAVITALMGSSVTHSWKSTCSQPAPPEHTTPYHQTPDLHTVTCTTPHGNAPSLRWLTSPAAASAAA